TRLDIKWFLRELLQSKYFYSARCRRARIASPVEYVVGTLRTLGVRWPASEVVEHLDAMGQTLFAPPNVKGWDGERAWINSDTWAARIAFAKAVSALEDDGGFGPNLDLKRLLGDDPGDPRRVVDHLAALLGADGLPADARRDLADYLITTD